MIKSFMAIVILLLLTVAVWQERRTRLLAVEVEQSQRELDRRAARLAIDKLQGHREEMVQAVAFVDDLYRSPDGLMRPNGLYNPDAQKVDAEAIGTWILDVYLQARIAGKSDPEARQSIADAVKGSDEGRRKHSDK